MNMSKLIRLDDAYLEHLAALKASNPKIVKFDQSAVSHQCPIHGKGHSHYFVANGVPAQYVCAYCWDSMPEAEGK